ncbi:MAG: hypothetical protein LBB62_03280 [Proteiniphilum sp.]|jgi:hypothetical protein|nr:hypothetical protein [Proteiniphilum sp.]
MKTAPSGAPVDAGKELIQKIKFYMKSIIINLSKRKEHEKEVFVGGRCPPEIAT